MADSEFEEFRYHFDTIPQHIKATAQTYTLVHDILLDDSPTSSKGSDNTAEYDDGKETQSTTNDDDLNRDYDSAVFTIREDSVCSEATHESLIKDKEGGWPPAQPKRRRKLPEIPKNKKPFNIKSLADELSAFQPDEGFSRYNPRNLLILKYLRDEETYFNDIDSGNSTAHSPEPAKSPPPYNRTGSDTPGSTECSSLLFSQLDLLEATHRGLHKFVPRHRDEMEVEIGDPIYVQKEADDLWCEGVNLRTGRQGIFPSAYAVDTEYDEFISASPKVKRERFLLGYLGSVETTQHKGTKVLTAAVAKIVAAQHKPHQTILEISDQGLRLVDKSRPNKIGSKKGISGDIKKHYTSCRPSGFSFRRAKKNHGEALRDENHQYVLEFCWCNFVREGPCLDYFYSLKNVSFCAFHPRDHRYLGFITKHPTLQRFACHVFQGSESTRPVAEAIGRAFERFYQKFIETAYPTEDIYIE